MNSFALRKEDIKENGTADLLNVGFDIKPCGGKPHAYTLVMKGFLAPGWAGRLTAGMAKQRIGIVSGEAEKVTTSAWHSRFELKSAPFSRDPLAIDYVALAGFEEPGDRTVSKIALLDFSMEQCTRYDGSLYLEIKGMDRLGFLGDLLDYFSMRCLFPVKMTIETVGDTAVDRFWLKGVGGSKPSESITAAVKENLETLLIPK